MTRTIISTTQAPAAIGTYSQAVRVGDTVYLNRATQVKTPLFSLRQTRAHRFGHARTWFACEQDHPTRSDLKALLASRPPA